MGSGQAQVAVCLQVGGSGWRARGREGTASRKQLLLESTWNLPTCLSCSYRRMREGPLGLLGAVVFSMFSSILGGRSSAWPP